MNVASAQRTSLPTSAWLVGAAVAVLLSIDGSMIAVWCAVGGYQGTGAVLGLSPANLAYALREASFTFMVSLGVAVLLHRLTRASPTTVLGLSLLALLLMHFLTWLATAMGASV